MTKLNGNLRDPLNDPPKDKTDAQAIAKLETALLLHRDGQVDQARSTYLGLLPCYADSFRLQYLLGIAEQQRGDLRASVRHLDCAIAIDPGSAQAHHYRAIALQSLGHTDEALDGYSQAISINPALAEAHNNRGNILLAAGATAKALKDYDAAIKANPSFAIAHGNRGNALRSLGRLEEALASHRRAISLDPAFTGAYNNCATVLRELGELNEALIHIDHALSLAPRFAEAHKNRGDILIDLGRWVEALSSFDAALSIEPCYPEALNNSGFVLMRLSRLSDAMERYDQAIALSPGLVDAHNNRANALFDLRRWNKALQAYDEALRLDPDLAEAWNNRGNLLKRAGHLDEAITSYDRALLARPRYASALRNRANAKVEAHRTEDALTDFQLALEIKPDTEFLLGQYLSARLSICDWRNLGVDLERIRDAIEAGRVVISPFSVLALFDDPALQRRAAEIYARHETGHLLKRPTLPAWGGHAKLKIGYFSADFRNHAVMHVMAEVLEVHDRSRFEVFGFSLGTEREDTMRQRARAAFDQFLDVSNVGDEEIAKLSRHHEIDIAIDLNGYTRNGRPGIFAHGCAPIQVNYLGFSGTMGCPAMDYVIVDPHVIPLSDEHHYTESVVRLPHTYMANDSTKLISERQLDRSEWGLPDRGFVFCCFNNSYKILPDMFSAWMRILQRVPDSVLWLRSDDPLVIMNLRREAELRGVEGRRLIFAPKAPLDEHLARHRLADLFLDCLPYNAHSTALDALWAGLPVLTCTGNSFASRVATSFVHSVGLPELATPSKTEFEDRAVELATNASQLRKLRDRLRHSRQNAPLFNARGLARNLEAAFLEIHDRKSQENSLAESLFLNRGKQ